MPKDNSKKNYDELLNQNYYDLLGVDRKASDADIRSAYRKRAFEFHPDRNKDSEAVAVYNRLGTAKDTLLNSKKRNEYDQSLDDSLNMFRSSTAAKPAPAQDDPLNLFKSPTTAKPAPAKGGDPLDILKSKSSTPPQPVSRGGDNSKFKNLSGESSAAPNLAQIHEIRHPAGTGTTNEKVDTSPILTKK